MAKIYNEIVIDMNPESPTFEETLHEDSFEYEGEMMLMQNLEDRADKDRATIGDPEMTRPTSPGGNVTFKYKMYEWNESTNKWDEIGTRSGTPLPEHYESMDKALAKWDDPTSKDWGAANITKDMFINADGKPKTIQEIYNTLDPLLPNMTGEKLKLQIRDMLPKYEGVSEEDKGYARKGFKKDVYGVSKDAGKAGAQMQQAYGSGMGSQMRGAYGAQKDVAQQYKFAEEGYEEDIYGLEKEAGAGFETGVADWLQSDWFTTPGVGTAQTTAWEGKQGGKVPTKEETFLDVLSKLPDAGGS